MCNLVVAVEWYVKNLMIEILTEADDTSVVDLSFDERRGIKLSENKA